MIGIYKITNNINGKCYIGQSINIEQRFKYHKACKMDKPLYRAFKKYGIENFMFEIIEECSIEELDEKEIYYIAFYNSTTDGNGYNLDYGGEFRDRTLSDEAEKKRVENFKKTVREMPKEQFECWHKKIGEKHKGKIVSEEQKEKISNTLKEYFKDENNRKKLSVKLKGKKLPLSTCLKLSAFQKENMKKYSKKVLQYDLQGNLIAEYNSLQEAGNKSRVAKSSISSCCNDKQNTAGGFKWKYDEEFNNKYRKQVNRVIKPKKPLKGRPAETPSRWKKVYQYDDEYNLIKVFNSFKEVETVFKSYKNVSCCCRGLREHAYGYRWSYTPIDKAS